jgi:hypothetical protein
VNIKQPQRQLRRILYFLIALAIAAIGAPEFQTGEQITVGAQEVIQDNFYAAGDRISLDGAIQGNVFAGGEAVTLTGTVNQDVYLAGEIITIEGTIKGDTVETLQAEAAHQRQERIEKTAFEEFCEEYPEAFKDREYEMWCRG